MAIPDEVMGLQARDNPDEDRFVLRLSGEERVSARSVVIAAEPVIAGLRSILEAFERRACTIGIAFGGKLCAGRKCSVGGNSAGQAWFI